ncbi:unnamed protein product [Rotaria socialis]|uniref:Uncharacterized protein n=1 Tax=Rotaria socialis TaxID=392032 RepID=A0A818F0D1_9BILA|nr:unnamed protein product [Rotaria socialis]CAF3686577.1 unnamed protein product [Rotaria socialis]CAF4628686.1 unnamed protein product [Rotaria socialis]CAF4852338.1 unnamed protein product [Rotaria socialis]
MDGVSIAVPLPHAHLMSFIEVFNNTNTCQNHIIANNQKEIKLFVHQHNMQRLLENSFVDTVPQLAKINIFCSSPGSKAFWSTYTQRYRRIIEQPFLYNELNFELLLFGCKHIKQLCECPEFSGDNSIRNRLNEDFRNISEALASILLQKITNLNDQIRLSEEAQY